jgi:N-methylhydantoinase A
MSLVIATDIGGTFTDLVAFDTLTKRVVHAKSHTEPEDLTAGIVRCLQKSRLVLPAATDFVHGSTVAINGARACGSARTSSAPPRPSPLR